MLEDRIQKGEKINAWNCALHFKIHKWWKTICYSTKLDEILPSHSNGSLWHIVKTKENVCNMRLHKKIKWIIIKQMSDYY
jgi:hypothetical protein